MIFNHQNLYLVTFHLVKQKCSFQILGNIMIRKPYTQLSKLITHLLILLLYSSLLSIKQVEGFETKAQSAVVYDELTRTVLLEKNSQLPIPPASMSKLMTIYMIFDALKTGRLNLEDEIKVSKEAASKGGSKMFLEKGEIVSIENLIRGIIIQSGNDACIAFAESLSGTEREFASEMNERARTLGLKNSLFSNSTGWPDTNHYMTAEDLIILAVKIREDFPNLYNYFKEKSFTWNGITQSNRNPLLGLGLGADGLKTGHTEEAGYGLVGSAKRGNRRVTFIVAGLNSSVGRANEAEKLLKWAYRDFKAQKIAAEGEVLGAIPTWLGEKKEVSLAPNEDLFILRPIVGDTIIKSFIQYDEFMRAPFNAGDKAPAKLVVSIQSSLTEKPVLKSFDLYSSEGSEVGNFFIRIKGAAYVVYQKILNSVN